MSRGWDEARTPQPSTSSSGPDPRDGDREQGTAQADRPDVGRAPEARQPVRNRDRWHALNETEWATLRTVGTFRVVAEGDLVAVHSHYVNAPGERGQAVVDLFRVRNGKIVEHWDVLQDVPATSANDNTMF